MRLWLYADFIKNCDTQNVRRVNRADRYFEVSVKFLHSPQKQCTFIFNPQDVIIFLDYM